MFYKKFEEIKNKDFSLAISDFDGFHKGQKKLLGELSKKAIDSDSKPIAIVLPKSKNDFLTTNKELSYYFKDIENLDVLFLEENSNIETLKEEIKKSNLNCKNILVEKELNDKVDLTDFCKENEISLTVEDTLKFDNEDITPTRIKKELTSGSLEKALKMLGHSYLMNGKVEHGKQLGQTVGMPTANLGVAKGKIFPEDGVYATNLEVKGEKFPGMTNIGKRPSVDDYSYKTIETFILNFSKDIYDEEIWLYVDKFVRPVKKFDCLADVKKQVNKDIEKVKQHYSSVRA